MGTIYYCNFSVFQSAPDSWAIEQLFPIMPFQRLHEEPTVRCSKGRRWRDDAVTSARTLDETSQRVVDGFGASEVHPYVLVHEHDIAEASISVVSASRASTESRLREFGHLVERLCARLTGLSPLLRRFVAHGSLRVGR